jgi:alkylation response protein AidB-like acyl-CoA dehydrogenase
MPRRGGPFFHLGWFGFGAVGHSAVVSGIMKRALEEVVTIVHGKSRLGYSCPVHEHPVFKHEFAMHEASYWAARHLVLDAVDICEMAAVAGEKLGPYHYSRLRQACSWIHKTAVEVVQFCHHWGASQAFRLPTALGRCTRDLSVATQHVIADEAAWVDNAGPIYYSWHDRVTPSREAR